MTIHRDTSPDSVLTPPGLSPDVAWRAGEAATQLTRPTQRERVLAQLRDGPTCGTEFLEMHIPRYAARIWELRELGRDITNESCWKHQHFSRQTIYRLRDIS